MLVYLSFIDVHHAAKRIQYMYICACHEEEGINLELRMNTTYPMTRHAMLICRVEEGDEHVHPV